VVRKVIVGNISASAGSNISLRGKIRDPIRSVISATVLADHSVNEGGTATYDILSATSATPTKVDEYTITLNVDITTKDLLELTYVAVTDYPAP